MLYIQPDVLRRLTKAFLSTGYEQGFLLGCTTRLNRLDFCHQIPAIQAGMYFFSPDCLYADSVIKMWAEGKICFCGFVHSHLVEKYDLSENDVEFALRLFSAFDLPVLWFGVGVVVAEKVKYQFYAISRDSGKAKIVPVNMKYYSPKEKEG